MGAYRKLYFWKKFIESVLIHTVDISTRIHSNHNVVVVGPSGVACYRKFEVFFLIKSSSVGLNMINHFKHIYPWRWIWLSDSIFIKVGVIIILGGLNKVGSQGGFFLTLAHFVEMSNFMAFFALGILGRTPLPQLVFMFSTSHALVLHPWGFSRLMTRNRRSLCSRFILSPIPSITSVLFAVLALVLSMDICSKIYRHGGIYLGSTLVVSMAICYF